MNLAERNKARLRASALIAHMAARDAKPDTIAQRLGYANMSNLKRMISDKATPRTRAATAINTTWEEVMTNEQSGTTKHPEPQDYPTTHIISELRSIRRMLNTMRAEANTNRRKILVRLDQPVTLLVKRGKEA